MATTEFLDRSLIRDAIRQRIDTVDDLRVLDDILTLADKHHTLGVLTPEQLQDIEISRQQFAAGLGIPHEEVIRLLDEEFPDDEN